MKKLSIRGETIRRLAVDRLSVVVGGATPQTYEKSCQTTQYPTTQDLHCQTLSNQPTCFASCPSDGSCAVTYNRPC